jgi:hypothetical protein
VTLTLPALLLLAAPGLHDVPQVELTLTKASAFWNGNQVLVVCDAVIDNRTKEAIGVRSTFFSAFDGLSIVVRNEKGKELLRQAYVVHQSPMALPGKRYELAVGENKHELRFPVDLPKDTGTIRVSLVGTLPNSGRSDLLLSDVVEVKVGPGK